MAAAEVIVQYSDAELASLFEEYSDMDCIINNEAPTQDQLDALANINERRAECKKANKRLRRELKDGSKSRKT